MCCKSSMERIRSNLATISYLRDFVHILSVEFGLCALFSVGCTLRSGLWSRHFAGATLRTAIVFSRVYCVSRGTTHTHTRTHVEARMTCRRSPPDFGGGGLHVTGLTSSRCRRVTRREFSQRCGGKLRRQRVRFPFCAVQFCAVPTSRESRARSGNDNDDALRAACAQLCRLPAVCSPAAGCGCLWPLPPSPTSRVAAAAAAAERPTTTATSQRR